MTAVKKYGVLLVNLGTPEAPTSTSVRAFLQAFLSDKRVIDISRLLWLPILYGIILPFRPKKVAANYKKIWLEGGSPLMVHSLNQQKKLQAHLEQSIAECSFKVELGMTYGKPSIPMGIESLKSWGADEIIVLPLYPQFSHTTTSAVADQLDKLSDNSSQHLTLINDYYQEPSYIQALAQSVEGKLPENSKLVMSFHGIPQRYVKQGDPYQQQCETTAQLLAKQLGLENDKWEMAYQSRVGREVWLKPYLDERMVELPRENVKDIVVMCPGFSADCLETLEEISMENRELFLHNGGKSFVYIDALNANQSHIKMMTTLIKSALNL
ncbi:ferrochelatase [Aliikangiella sp. IMCC44359]|uniref:ferrochelatase n=1 Tax=Aliikangiella sp. IMCC44359 TaxID=3459125 RepID=UPI00403B240A